MGPISGIVVYVCIWWVMIFCVLPIGVTRSDVPPEEGIAAAPVHPMLMKKFILTTILSAVFWVFVYVLVANDVIDFRSMSEHMVEAEQK